MAEINLLDLYPKTKRDLEKRAAVKEEDRILARRFGKEYFDGTRDQGYGGYKYDGRWAAIVKRFKEHYSLPEDASILDVGCAKGYMLHDFKALMPYCAIAGIDISEYAIKNAIEDTRPYLNVADCTALPYPDRSFDLVVSINTVHNLKEGECRKAVKEIERVGRRHKFIVVDAYRNEEEKMRIYKWNLTAQTILDVDGWRRLFEKAGYSGDYYWFIP